MQVRVPGSFAAPIYAFVMLLALGFSTVANAKAPADDESPAGLNRRILELYGEGKFREAIPLAERLVPLTKEPRGLDDLETAASINLLALLYKSTGEYAKAEPLYKEALEIRQKVLGREHPDTALSLNNLALLYQAMGDYGKTEPLLKEALEIRQKVLGREHRDTATKSEQSGGALLGDGRLCQSRTAAQRGPGDSPKSPWSGASRYGDKA